MAEDEIKIENERVSSTVFAAGVARVGSFVAVGAFDCGRAGGSQTEIQAAGRRCLPHSEDGRQAGQGRYRLLGEFREGSEDSSHQRRVYPERSVQSDARRLGLRGGEASKFGRVSRKEANFSSSRTSLERRPIIRSRPTQFLWYPLTY